MSQTDPTAVDLGFDRRADRAKKLPSPHVEDEDQYKSVEWWMRSRFAPMDRYLATIPGTVEARVALEACR